MKISNPHDIKTSFPVKYIQASSGMESLRHKQACLVSYQDAFTRKDLRLTRQQARALAYELLEIADNMDALGNK